MNELIREMTALLQSETARYSIRSMKISPLGFLEAMKDMGAPGMLTISSNQNGDDQLLVSVADMGIGLQENVEQIFSAFFTSKSQGTGMGLTISRSIIETHGGRLWATANRGPGATFQFVLPVKVTAHSVIQPAPSRT